MSAQPGQSDAPTPHDTLSDEVGCTISWLASAWSFEDIDYENAELELTPDRLSEIWMRCRWTTPNELADPDRLYDLFGGDHEDGIDTSVVYMVAEPGAEGAHRYLTTEGR